MLEILGPVIRAVIAVAAVIAFTRMNGLRSFSKMSSFDFAITVAMGTLVAGTVTGSPGMAMTIIGMAAIFAVQHAISTGRVRMGLSQLVDNDPLMLMDGPEILEENLRAAKITKQDLIAKLREANALNFDDVQAVVLETTGDISVLHGDKMDQRLLEGVRRTP